MRITTLLQRGFSPIPWSAILLATIIPSVSADILPRSGSLNYSQKSLSNAGNPASAALTIERNDPHVMTGGLIEIGAGVEYGDLDELFELIDEISESFKPPVDDGSSKPPTPENPIRDYTWQDLLDEYPELKDRVDELSKQVTNAAGLFALIATEGYGKAEATSNASFVLNDDLYGGTLLGGIAFKGNAKVLGIFEDINFDSEQAKEALQSIPDFNENDPIQALDLSAGIILFYNPANNQVKLTFDNDSLLLVKSTKILQFSLGYSNKALQTEHGALHWGVKPSFYRVGLTNVTARIGELSDTKAIFEDIKNADYIYKTGADVDLGIVWSADHYQIGASVSNLIESSYKYPELDRQGLRSEDILQELNQHQQFTLQRQVKLEAGIYTDQRHWSLHTELDANPVEDPMGDKYQWFNITAGYAADSWWLPSARIGISRNLAGTKLGFLNAGVTMMKFINLDVASTLETVTLDNNKMLRGVNIRLGVQFEF